VARLSCEAVWTYVVRGSAAMEGVWAYVVRGSAAMEGVWAYVVRGRRVIVILVRLGFRGISSYLSSSA